MLFAWNGGRKLKAYFCNFYFSCAENLSSAAFAQASSLSPLGAPPTPRPPSRSLPALIGIAPASGIVPEISFTPAAAGLATRVANSPDVMPKLADV